MRIRGKRIKWEPGALFAFVLILGVWLTLGPDAFRRLPTRDDAATYEVRIADSRGKLEVTDDPSGNGLRFRIMLRDGYVSPDMTAEQLKQIYGPTVYAQAIARPNAIFQLFNITSWGSLMWVAIGFSGQLAFSFRMLIQWWVSEKRRESHVPMAFWLWSLVGSVMLFAYFIWRQDPVGVLGQCTGLVVYARNLRLIHKTRRRAARQGAADDGDDLDIDGDQNDDDAGDEPDHRATGDGFQARHDGSRRRPPAAAEVKLAPAGEPTSDLRN